jgi:hypothetical protein
MKKMKKMFFISAVLVVSLTSCKKDYTCVCSASILGTTVSVTSEAKSSKKGAENWCKSMENPSETQNGTSTTNSFPLTCALK